MNTLTDAADILMYVRVYLCGVSCWRYHEAAIHVHVRQCTVLYTEAKLCFGHVFFSVCERLTLTLHLCWPYAWHKLDTLDINHLIMIWWHKGGQLSYAHVILKHMSSYTLCISYSNVFLRDLYGNKRFIGSDLNTLTYAHARAQTFLVDTCRPVIRYTKAAYTLFIRL